MHKLPILLISLILVGCSETPSDINFNYHSRLQSQLTLSPLIAYSDSHNLINPAVTSAGVVPETKTISLLQLAQIQHCKLGRNIAEHNSQLGKLAVISNKFIYQINFIKSAKDCIASIDDPLLKTEIAAVLNYKIERLNDYWRELVFNDAQLRSLYLASSYSIDKINQDEKQNTFLALSYFHEIKLALQNKQFEQINIENLEFYLSKLYRNVYLPSLLRAIKEQVSLTEQQTKMLNMIEFNTICRPNLHSDKSTILTNIFTKFYGQRIQQYQNLLLKEYQFISPTLKSLWSDLANKPYNDRILSLDTQLKSASLGHVTWWQGLYKACNLVPGV